MSKASSHDGAGAVRSADAVAEVGRDVPDAERPADAASAGPVGSSGHTVRQVMTKGVFAVGGDARFMDIAALLFRVGISAVPVTDGRGRVLGVVSEADLLSRANGPYGRRERTEASSTHAWQLMTAPAITVDADADVASAAALLRRHNIRRLPVVDPDGTLVGIVSRRDLLGTLLWATENTLVPTAV